MGFRFREMVPDYVDDVAFDLPSARAGMTDGCCTAILWASGIGEGS